MANGLSYDFGEQNILDYKYRIINVGNIKYIEVIGTDYYGLYSLLPLRDKKEEGQNII